MVRSFVQIPSEEVKKVDPDHLNFGLCYAWISSNLLYAAGETFDVFTINHYNLEPDVDMIEALATRIRRPVLIGEYHFGALDASLPSTGLQRVAYRRYLEVCAASSALMGAYYFQLNDQNVLGRFDGENYNIGFVEVCQKPYPAMVEAARTAHERMYALHTCELTPVDRKPLEIPRIAF